MADERDDILAKANRLLQRHLASAPGEPDAADVPVLTDLVEDSGGRPPGQTGASVPEPDLVAEVVADVTHAVESRLAADLERRLTEHLVAQVQSSVAAAMADLRQDIANAVGDSLAESLARRNRE